MKRQQRLVQFTMTLVIAILAYMPVSALAQIEPVITILPDYDAEFASECSEGTVYPDTGGISCEYSVAEARRGNNSPNGDQELLVRPGGTFTPIMQAQRAWQTSPFTWKLEGTSEGDVRFIVFQGSEQILNTFSGEYEVNPNNTKEVYIRLRGASSESGETALFTLSSINGIDVQGGGIDSDGTANYLLVQCMNFMQEWSMEGTAEFFVLTGPGTGGSAPSFQIKLTEELTANSIVCEPASVAVPTLTEWGIIAMAGVFGIIAAFAIRRRKFAV